MSKAKDTLRALVVSLNVGDEALANTLADELDTAGTERLIEALMSGVGGPTLNLPQGAGGYLAGLRQLVDSRLSRTAATLPVDPKKVTQTQKEAAIEGFTRDLEKSDDRLGAGLTLLLDARAEESLDKFRAWPGELSDEDFPRKVALFRQELEERNKAIIEGLRQKFKDDRIDVNALLKKHRTEAEQP
jgi:hypothetical protein